jgi:hypothetical protein
VGFVVDKAAVKQNVSEFFGFLCHTFCRLLHTHQHPSSEVATIGQSVAEEASGLSLAPPQETNKIKSSVCNIMRRVSQGGGKWVASYHVCTCLRQSYRPLSPRPANQAEKSSKVGNVQNFSRKIICVRQWPLAWRDFSSGCGKRQLACCERAFVLWRASEIFPIVRCNLVSERTGNETMVYRCNGMLSCLRNRPWRPIGFWDIKHPTMFRKSAHRLQHRPRSTPQKHYFSVSGTYFC